MWTYLGEKEVDDPVEEATENLISHKNSNVKIADDECAVKLLGVWEMTRGRQHKHDHVSAKGEGEKFAVCSSSQMH